MLNFLITFFLPSLPKDFNVVSSNCRTSIIFLLNDSKLIRYTNLVEAKNTITLDALENNDTKQLSLYSYKSGDNIINYIGYMNYDNPTENNNVLKVTYNILEETFTKENISVDGSGLSDEKIVLVDEDEYIYYYDEDSIYIAPVSNTENPKQISEDALTKVLVQDGILYVVSKNYIKLFDVSNKDDIDDSKLYDTVNVANAKSIFVDKENNRLFVGANNRLEIYNISDKNATTLLTQTEINFESGDMYYEGTPTSIYMQNNQLVSTVENVGLIIYSIDEFNMLTREASVLNIGEKISDIYSLDNSAINYTIENENSSKELKVYFYGKTLLDADSVATLKIVDGSVNEGCFIATAAYGSYFQAHVKTLRDFRDNYLLTNELGTEFVTFYYKYSPPIAKVIAQNEFMKFIVRVVLTPVVYMITYPISLLFIIVLFMMYRGFKTKKTLTIRKSL